jgi:hypothetical protein
VTAALIPAPDGLERVHWRERIRAETADYVRVLFAWLLVGVPVGWAVTAGWTALTAGADARAGATTQAGLTAALVVGALVVSALEAAGRRVTAGESLVFVAVYLFVQVPCPGVAFLLLDGVSEALFVDVVPVAVASVVTFHWGPVGTARRAKGMLDRALRTPDQRPVENDG